MMNRYVLPLIVVILFTSVNLSLAQSSAKEALEYYCKKKHVDTSISKCNVIKVVKLSDSRDSTVPFIDSFCRIVQDGASILGKEVYAIEIHSDSQFKVEMVWYSWVLNKLYLISEVDELEDWIEDQITYKTSSNHNIKWFSKRTTYKNIKAQLYLALMTYNCYYNQNLYIPSRVIKRKSRLRRYIVKHPMVFSISKN